MSDAVPAPRSDVLVSAPTTPSVRSHYLAHPLGPPLLAASPFLPRPVIERLMRSKKDSALGVKYVPGDTLTNMDGCAHTFLTPIVLARMHGDYAYDRGHSVRRFRPGQAREVLVSAAIQPDFENRDVMLALAKLEPQQVEGLDWNGRGGRRWEEQLPGPAELYDPRVRTEYDHKVRRHLIFHLVGSLPALAQVEGEVMSSKDAVSHLENVLARVLRADQTGMDELEGLGYVRLDGGVVSLRLLFRIYLEQLSNELGALESHFPQGYVYTSDPPSIFAREADPRLLNRLQALALAHLCQRNQLRRMKVWAFNDYADPALPLFIGALRGSRVKVMRKADIFPSSNGGYYAPPKEAEGAILVIHNNSDGFGQNIETEGPGSSLDGAIGCTSSVAGSLRRDRKDLLSQVLGQDARLRI